MSAETLLIDSWKEYKLKLADFIVIGMVLLGVGFVFIFPDAGFTFTVLFGFFMVLIWFMSVPTGSYLARRLDKEIGKGNNYEGRM